MSKFITNNILIGLQEQLEAQKRDIIDQLDQEISTFERTELMDKKKNLSANIDEIKKEIKE